tara:strand:+ start:4818 stop:5129 length:312 start_codon:yes stop_codon:yes gene_type:complete
MKIEQFRQLIIEELLREKNKDVRKVDEVMTDPEYIDNEGRMAKSELYKLKNYAEKLQDIIQDQEQLDGWVQAKITKAADYLSSVVHYLEYEKERDDSLEGDEV